MDGKLTCEVLKKVRKQIADANGIPYEPVVCNHKGPCSGTCPVCEAEARYIERELLAKQKKQESVQIVGVAKDALPSTNEWTKRAAALAITAASCLSAMPNDVQASTTDNQINTVVKADSQRVVIKGVVQDSSSVLPSVYVAVLNTEEEVFTDENGRFEVSANVGDTLFFEYFGYATLKMNVDGPQENLVVTMQEDTISAGAQALSPIGQICGAIGVTSIYYLEPSIYENIVDSYLSPDEISLPLVLLNTTSGQPGAPTSKHFHGYNTLLKGTPLCLYEDVPINGIFSWNPHLSIGTKGIDELEYGNHGETMARYGSSSAIGLVNVYPLFDPVRKYKLWYRGDVSLSQFTKRYKLMNANQYADYVNNQLVDVDRSDGENPIGMGNTNWQDELFRNALGHSHYLNMKGSDNWGKNSYSISLGYANQDGVITSSGFERINGHAFAETNANDWLKLSMDLHVNRQNIDLVANIAKPWLMSPSLCNFRGTDNNVLMQTLLQAPTDDPRQADGTLSGPQNANVTMNPIAELENSPLHREETNIIGKTCINVLFSEHVSWRNSLVVNSTNANEHYFQPSYNYGTLQRTTQDAALFTGDFNSNHVNFWSTVDFVHRFAKIHRTTFNLSAVVNHYDWNEQVVVGQGFASNALSTMNLAGTTNLDNQFSGDGNLYSFRGVALYEYRNCFSAKAVGMYDKTDGLLMAAQDAFYPGCSMTYNFSDFIDYSDFRYFIKDLYLAVNYGELGNNYLNVPAYWQLLSQNLDLKWERTKQVDASLKFRSFDRQLFVELDAYYKKSEDLILFDKTHQLFLNAGNIENKGFDVMAQYSTDYSLYKEKKKPYFQGELSFSKNQSKVLDLGPFNSVTDAADPFGAYSLFGNEMNVNRTEKGGTPGRFYGYRSLGIIQNESELKEYVASTGRTARVGDEKFSAEKEFIGDPNPKFSYGFVATLRWRGWHLSAQLVGSYGNDVYNLVRQRLSSQTASNMYCNLLADCVNFARVETDANGNSYVSNPSTTIPRPNYSNTDEGSASVVSDRFVEDGSFLKLQHMGIAYTWPAEKTDRWHINDLKLKFSVENLHTFTKYSGYDPENPGSAVRQGVDEGRYPSPRTYRLSLSFEL